MTQRLHQNSHSERRFSPMTQQANETSDVILFVDKVTADRSAIRHAQIVARAFGGKVVLAHVQCRHDNGNGPVDPVEWDIRTQQARVWLDDLIKDADTEKAQCEAQLLEGPLVGQIQSFVAQHQGDIAAAIRLRGQRGWTLNAAARGVLMSRSAGVMMIPQDDKIGRQKTYDRILVPLDGSPRAEIALPKAVGLARQNDAELLLLYVAPEPGITEFGVKDQQAEHLRDAVSSRNEQAGKSYLSRIKNRLAQDGLKLLARVRQSGDARRALMDAISDEKVDLVVMATHGQSGHRDVPTGDVARYVLEQAEIPVLLVRFLNGTSGNHVFGNLSSEGVRQPVGTD